VFALLGLAARPASLGLGLLGGSAVLAHIQAVVLAAQLAHIQAVVLAAQLARNQAVVLAAQLARNQAAQEWAPLGGWNALEWALPG